MRTTAAILALLALPTALCAKPAPTTAPSLDATNYWRAYQVGCWNPLGCVSPKIGVVFDAIGPLEGENDVFDGVSYNGFSQFMAERYDVKDHNLVGVGAYEVVGGFLGAALMSTRSDPADAGMLLFTTEFQTVNHNGMGLELDYTPNGSVALTRGLSVSPEGKGGVTIGGGGAHNHPYKYKRPADLGPGTLHVADSMVVGNHLASDGQRPTLEGCGAGAMIDGTDAAGQVTNGGAITSCTVKFARPYASNVVCIVQDFARPTPAPYLTELGAGGFKASWSSGFGGRWFYMCQGVS
jgi:hypothetical protein